MKNSPIFFAFAAALIATTSVLAQTPAPVPPPCPCPKAFQGVHLGGNLGGGFGTAKQRYSLVSEGTVLTTLSNNTLKKGIDGGVNVGYTHRVGNVGLGLEFVANWSGAKAQLTNLNSFSETTTLQARLRNSLQVRTNLSYVICNLVAPKLILGWDNSEWMQSFNLSSPSSPLVSQQKTKRLNGFLWGAGIDVLLAQHFIMGVEYTGVNSQKMASTATFSSNPGDVFSTRIKPQYNKFAIVAKFIY